MTVPARGRGWFRAAVAVLVLAAAAGVRLDAQTRASEQDVKAAYVFNFTQFVRWPSDALAPGQSFGVCVVGDDPFGPALDRTFAGESIRGHRAVVRRLRAIDDVSACQIAYLGAASDADLATMLEAAARGPVLTVGDWPGFATDGGMVGFVSVQNRVRFEINLAAAVAARLTLSSDLARVATAVHGLARAR